MQLSEKQQKDLAAKFLGGVESSELLSDQELKQFCRNPLYLFLMCALFKESGSPSPKSRWRKFQALHNFIITKACNRLNEDQMKRRVLTPLYRLAFDANFRGWSVLLEEDLVAVSVSGDVLCDAGFLVKSVKIQGLKPVVRYFFHHKSFQEFFSVLHVLSLDSLEFKEWLRSLDLKLDQNLICFLFGLVEEAALREVASLRRAREHQHLYEIFISEVPQIHALRDVVSKHLPTSLYFHDD
jgi:hypothetical protein